MTAIGANWCRLTTKAPPAFLDLRGLNCPMPALRTRKMLRRLAHGGFLTVECTDPLSVIDIPDLLRKTGDMLERQEAADGVYIFHIRRGKHESCFHD